MEIDGIDLPQDFRNSNTIVPTTEEITTAITTSNINNLESLDIDNCAEMSNLSESDSGLIDDHLAIDRPFNMNERFVTILDQLDTRVEKLRKDALGLQEKRDFLLMSIDLIKHNENFQSMDEYEREEIFCYMKRVSSRLSTIELNVKTVRDTDQEDSLCQVNTMIDSLITINDPVMSRQRCQSFLNACSASDINPCYEEGNSSSSELISGMGSGAGNTGAGNTGAGLFHDKKFESALLGCTLDDQKTIKRRLLALMNYLNQQTVSD